MISDGWGTISPKAFPHLTTVHAERDNMASAAAGEQARLTAEEFERALAEVHDGVNTRDSEVMEHVRAFVIEELRNAKPYDRVGGTYFVTIEKTSAPRDIQELWGYGLVDRIRSLGPKVGAKLSKEKADGGAREVWDLKIFTSKQSLPDAHGRKDPDDSWGY